MTTEQSRKNILPVEIATKLKCSICTGYLSNGPIKMRKETYICGRCTTKENDAHVLPPIFETFLDSFTFPCKYYKEGCKKTVLFNDTQKHEFKCSQRVIPCPELNCTDEIIMLRLFRHFQMRHISRIINNFQFKLDVNQNDKQNLLKYESDCIVIIKYCYIKSTKNLRLSIAPVDEKARPVDKYKLQICNEADADNNINFSPKLCHVYTSQYLKTGEFDSIKVSDYLSILNNPKDVLITISLTYSNNTPVNDESLITYKTDEVAQLDDVIEENATNILQQHLEDNNAKSSNMHHNSFYGSTHHRASPMQTYNPMFLNSKPHRAIPIVTTNSNVPKPIGLVPCKWKGCKQSGNNLEISEHQDVCEFKLYICPFLHDCEQGLFQFNFSFLTHLATHAQHCQNPNKIAILLYNPNILYRKQKINNYFTILNKNIVRITCTIETNGDWKIVCSSTIQIKINIYFSHEHCRLTFKGPERAGIAITEYTKSQFSIPDCFVNYPRLNAILKIEAC